MRRRTALVACSAALAVGLTGAVVVPLVWGSPGHRVAPTSTFDAGAATRLATEPATSTSATPTPRSKPAPKPASRSSSRRPTTSRSTPRTAVSAPRGTGPGPVSITIASVGIGAAIAPVGVQPSGDVEIPERVDRVGWYRFGAKPGTPQGSTVLVGHVDSAQQGAGAFFRLREVANGATVRLTMPDGAVKRYRVIARELFVKGHVPLGALFSLTGAPRLTLITCGGSFDAQVGSYRDNVVVTAVPV